jgi:hypothetical protein
MNKFYAQTDENGNVHTVCSLAGDISVDNAIKLDKMDKKLLNSKYDKNTKEFTKTKDGKVFKYNKVIPGFEEVAE